MDPNPAAGANVAPVFLTFKFRIKDATVGKYLDRHARAVNQVWNYCNEIQRESQARWRAGRKVRWPTDIDLNKLCTGVAVDLGIHSDTVNLVCRQYARSRDAARSDLRWRPSLGAKRALGWVPFVPRAIQVSGACITYKKRKFYFWKSRDIVGDIKNGAFVQDARGRWYVTFVCSLEPDRPKGEGRVGIDLGLKDIATLSDGTKVPALKHYRQYEKSLATAQRAKNKRRVRAIHAKIANARRHHLHEWSAKIARENEIIVVGNVSPSKLAKTKMAKSIYDASWAMLRSQLRYKASRHGAVYIEADERWTSQVCSCCGSISASSPKGMGALGVRRWSCDECGADHDRDVNAAQNILRVGLKHQPPEVESLPKRQGRC